MGNLYDYFSAAGDDSAATAIDLIGGPAVPGRSTFDAVFTKGIDPSVQMATLEELLTGRPIEEIFDDPRSAHPIGPETEDAEHGVVTLTDNLTQAVAAADRARLAEVAVPWSETEEFWGQSDPEFLTEFLVELSGLARRAIDRGNRLYCWWSL